MIIEHNLFQLNDEECTAAESSCQSAESCPTRPLDTLPKYDIETTFRIEELPVVFGEGRGGAENLTARCGNIRRKISDKWQITITPQCD